MNNSLEIFETIFKLKKPYYSYPEKIYNDINFILQTSIVSLQPQLESFLGLFIYF